MTNDSLISQLQLIQQLSAEALKKLQKEQKPKKRKGLSEADKAKAIMKRESLINKSA